MTPAQAVALARIADDLERFTMTRNARELRALIASDLNDERPCPIQDGSGQTRAIPWGLAEILYPAYGHGQTLERLAERGGFGRLELGYLAVDAYGAQDESRLRPRLRRMPILDLYDLARRALA